MEIYSEITDLTTKYPRMVVALGMFDGVHRGHASVIRRTVELAREAHGTPVVFTFSSHPLAVLAPEAMPLQISNSELRAVKFAELGVAVLVSIPFTREFAAISPDDFLHLLKANFAPRAVVTGANYTFGYRGLGTIERLRSAGAALGFSAEVCPAVETGGELVSSTRIRRLIARDDLAAANDCLGYPFTVIDTVQHGDKRGRTIGFPTANIAIGAGRAMLNNGVYAARVIYNGKRYNAVANIGDNPTFTGCYRRLEVNIMDFSADIYGEQIAVEFLAKLREEQKFSGIDELVAAINNDKKNAAHYW